MPPVLSIILPVYNGEIFLARAIESVCCQKFQSWELIIINDGSTDRSEAIARRFCSQDARIRCQTQRNLGLSAARNAGVRLALGIYIAFLDADDSVEPDYYDSLTAAARRYDSDFFMAGFTLDFAGQGKKAHSVSVLFKEDVLDSLEKKQVFCDNPSFYNLYIHVWNKLYRRQFLSDHKICFDETLRFGEDVPFNLACLAKAQSIVLLPAAGYHYICHSSKRITGGWKEWLLDENRRIYNEIDRFEKMEWRLECPWISSGMYLRGCFLTVEKLLQSERSGRNVREEIGRVLAAEETRRSVAQLERHCGSLEFSIYRRILKTQRPLLFLMAVYARRGIKRLLHR